MKKYWKRLCWVLVFALLAGMCSGCGKKNDSVDFVRELKMGWNLGNTFDTDDVTGLEAEMAWGQPETTRELIDYVKAAGFTTIRIPVSWGMHMDENGTIDKEWMDRVNTVVDYALDAGFYVIINSHHDCDFYYPSKGRLEESKQFIASVWGQIAEHYKDYDERLIFESMNEPRLMGTSREWGFNPNDKVGISSIECIMELNQLFVDTVRASGGYNEKRYLMVPGNAASADNALNEVFFMPEDEAKHLILSVHAYTPYDFAMNANGYTEWDESKESELAFMDKLYEKYVKEGYGVVIGECGAINKNNIKHRIAWADSYTAKASSLGMSCIIWDNGVTDAGAESFGMIDRTNLKVYYPGMLKVMFDNYRE